jgi:predicted DNA-binding transcriptional regulator YafY
MDYNRGAKVYLAAKDFTPIFASTNSAGFLNELLALERGLLTKETMPLGWAPEVSVAPVPSRPLSANLLAALLQAVRDKASLSIGYQSMSSPEPVARVISPHAFAHDGSRWHVRAWCHMRGQYRDFVIGRILEASPSELASPPITGDLAWLNVLELVISPHPNLSAGQRRVIELDYGMENGEARISCREALLFYVVKHLRLDQDVGAAREQQIVWKNRHELDRYLKS